MTKSLKNLSINCILQNEIFFYNLPMLLIQEIKKQKLLNYLCVARLNISHNVRNELMFELQRIIKPIFKYEYFQVKQKNKKTIDELMFGIEINLLQKRGRRKRF